MKNDNPPPPTRDVLENLVLTVTHPGPEAQQPLGFAGFQRGLSLRTVRL